MDKRQLKKILENSMVKVDYLKKDLDKISEEIDKISLEEEQK